MKQQRRRHGIGALTLINTVDIAQMQRAIEELRLEHAKSIPTPEDRAADREDVKAGIIPLETARARQGLLDSKGVQVVVDRERDAAPVAEAVAEVKPVPDVVN